MASRISQMRNGQQPYPQTQQAQRQQALNEAIERTRAMMQQIKMAQDPQAALAQMLQNNPNSAAIVNLLHQNNGSLEQIARQMAQSGGFDINKIIQGLSGGM